jgi:hypothetical protein
MRGEKCQIIGDRALDLLWVGVGMLVLPLASVACFHLAAHRLRDELMIRESWALAFRTVTRYIVTRYRWRNPMAAAAERMKMMRQRRRARGLRELRLVVADPRSRAVRRRVAKQVASLDPDRERDALNWIESVSEFGADATR